MANKTAQRLLRFLAGRFRDTQADGKVYALQNGTLLDVTSVTQKALSTVPLTVTSAGQTAFSVPGGYTPGLLQVARNGILQSFTGTDGSTITLASGTVSTNDTVTAYVFATFQVANALMLSGGTMTGPLVSPGILMTGSLNQAPIVTLASASTVNIGAAAANTIQVTGTTTITAFDTVASGIRKTLRFSGALTLTYDATKMILPRAANIVTVAGDSAEFVSLGSGNWACLSYDRATAAAAKSDLSLTKSDVGLANVDNTSDVNKPVSTAQQTALDAKAPLANPIFSNTARIYGPSGEPRFILDGPAGLNKYFTFYTAGVQRFQFGMSSAAESGGNAGSNFYINRFGDDGNVIGNTMTVARNTGEIVLWGATQTTGPFRPAQYTLTTLPSASANNGYEIDVTNATGGPKRCRSNGTNWIILNTTTTVS